MPDHTAAALSGNDIALVGMAGRFPGAGDVAELWATVRAGRSGVTRFTDAELRAAGVPPERLADPAYVKAGAVIDGVDRFDAGFFGFSPRDAQILDPQHRLFLEHSWHVLEDAACDPARFNGAIGVFAGCAWSSYLTNNLTPADVARDVGEMAVAVANDKDSLPLRVAHLLGLSGPAFGVQSNCSTSLVAVCVAASSLANFECDMALAGGVAIGVPHRVGYLYQQGGIAPPDGECRAFDAAGQGAPLGSGVGVVALRRLEDAIADGDRVYAVLRGWAINNDAGRKVGFTAPGVQGQAAVIAEALAAAGLAAADIDYVEAHGTGTALGDAAELAALQQVFHGTSLRIGSIKTNIGHLDRAAGVTGLMKTALALHHAEIPPSRNFTVPNPQLAAGGAELRVSTERQPWPRCVRPRRAGVSAFGIGGTNAHVVIEEAPPVSRPAGGGRPEVLVWSARSVPAADQITTDLAGYLETTADCRLADVANTLQRGRAVFPHRRMLVADSPATAAAMLRGGVALDRVDGGTDRPVGFLIADDGGQYPGMAADLYATEPLFRRDIDACRDILLRLTGTDPLTDMPRPGSAPHAGGERGQRPDLGTLDDDSADRRHPALFAVEYALAQLVRSWGVEPSVVVGHGVGEYVAACLAGVLTLEHALALVVHRARLIRALPGGIAPRRRRPLVDPRPLEPLHGRLSGGVADTVTLNPPAVPYVSTVTGALVTTEQVTDPAFWAEHMCASARLDSALAAVLADDRTALLEFGPGQSLGVVVRGHRDYTSKRSAVVVPTLPSADDPRPSGVVLAEAAGQLWLAGVPLDWAAYQQGRSLSRVGLPRYPFQRQRYWIDPPSGARAASARVPDGTRASSLDAADERVRLLVPRWQPIGPGGEAAPADTRYVIVPDAGGVGDALACALRRAGADVVRVPDAEHVADCVNPLSATVVDLTALDWSGHADDPVRAVLELSRSLAECAGDGAGATRVVVVTRGGQAVTGTEYPTAAQAAVALLPVVANQEYLNLDGRTVDLDPEYAAAEAAEALAAELSRPSDAVLVAHRAGRRYRPGYLPAEVARPDPACHAGRRYLITGGLGHIGLTVAEHLARGGAVRLVLVSRSGIPDDPADPRGTAVARLRALGVDVRTPRVDVTDRVALRELFTGERIDGVVHAAAEVAMDTLLPLCDLDEAVVARHFAAKVGGAQVLAAVLDSLPVGRAPDWCLLFSSTSALLGGITLGSYAAANAALAVQARGRNRTGTRWIAAAWDTWAGTLQRLDGRIGATMADHVMSDTEALAAFDRVVGQAEPGVVVAAGGLDDRLPTTRGAETVPVAATTTRYPRPELTQPYAPPRTATEHALAEAWSSVLGLEPVGADDNFFDLGGNSLVALQMLTLVKQRFGIAIPTTTLFELPTVHALADVLDGRGDSTAGIAARCAADVAPPRRTPVSQ